MGGERASERAADTGASVVSDGAVGVPSSSSSSSRATPALVKQGSGSDIQTRAQRAQMHYDIACLRWTHGNVREAYEDLKEASRLDPNNMVIWQKYEEAYRAVQKTLAEEHLERQSSGGAAGMYAAGSSAQRLQAPATPPAASERSYKS